MKFIDIFSGIGTVRMGFEQAGWECVYSIEWDKHKRRIYEIIFGNEPEGKDICAVRGLGLPRADCWTFGAPCQDFSIAGKRAGLGGDRSSMVREVFRLFGEIEEEYRPTWLLYENVKGMLSSNKGFDYFEILSEMDALGYDIEWQLLNSKNFGVPHNRERMYTIGHLRGRSTRKVFPISTRMDCKNPAVTITARGYGSQKNGTYVIENPSAIKQIGNIMPTKTRENPNQGRVYDIFGISPGLNKMEGGGRQPFVIVPEATKQGYAIAEEGDSINFAMPNSATRRGRVGKRVANTLDTSCNKATLHNGRIRRLTPKECMRLQGVPDEYTDKLITNGISDTQIYRGSGDACTVNVIYEIAKRLEYEI